MKLSQILFFYQNGIKSLIFQHYKPINLSDKLISNIREIKPKSVYLINDFLYRGKLNFVDILSGLPSKMKITFKKSDSYDTISLWFSNTVLKIFQNDRDYCTLLEWKSFKFEVYKKYLEDIKGEYHCRDPHSDWLALCLDNYNKVEFEDFSLISNKEQADEVDHYFPPCIPDSFNEWTVFILAKDLIEANLDSWITPRKTNFGALQWLVSKWSKLKSFTFPLLLSSDSEYISKISNLSLQNIKLVADITTSKLQL